MSIFARALRGIIRWYQITISAGTPRRCRYEPTCSAYALEAIEIHGAIKGTILAGWRILRCNPWSKGGVDFVPEKGAWPRPPMDYEQLMEYRRLHERDESEPGAANSERVSSDGETPSRLNRGGDYIH